MLKIIFGIVGMLLLSDNKKEDAKEIGGLIWDFVIVVLLFAGIGYLLQGAVFVLENTWVYLLILLLGYIAFLCFRAAINNFLDAVSLIKRNKEKFVLSKDSAFYVAILTLWESILGVVTVYMFMFIPKTMKKIELEEAHRKKYYYNYKSRPASQVAEDYLFYVFIILVVSILLLIMSKVFKAHVNNYLSECK